MTTRGATAASAEPGLSRAITAGVTAVVVGYASSVAILIAAASALKATQAEAISWLTAICITKALATLILTGTTRMPIVVAWSTPGAVLIAAAPPQGGLSVAVGAFIIAGVLLVLTGFIKPLERLVARIPIGIASAMLAGILFKFVADVFASLATAGIIVGPMLVAFFLARAVVPMIAALIALGVGFIAASISGQIPQGLFVFRAPELVFVTPSFTIEAAIGLAVPLYLVTMASQNLAGAAVLKAQGYVPPMGRILSVTGGLSIVGAFFAAHTINLAAISAAICTGPDVHPDKAKRWPAGIVYALAYGVLTLLGGTLYVWLDALPTALIIAFAGLALISSFAGALASAVADPGQRFAAVTAFAVSASGLTFIGVGAAFWGLVAGLLVYGLDLLAAQRAAPAPRVLPGKV